MSEAERPWNETVEPAARRLQLSAQLNLDTVVSPDAAAAIVLLLKRMAQLLDDQIAIQAKRNRRKA